MKKRETKSPIKDLPVRLPGQSVRDQIDEVLWEKTLTWVFVALFVVVLAVLEWLYSLLKLPRSPWTITIMAVGVVAFAAVKVRRGLREVRALRLGRIGEEAVGQFLEEQLRPHGFHVLHDIPGDGFNVDHAVIGPTGVYCVETKTHSKPARGRASVTYDGNEVRVDGLTPDRDPLGQAKAGAAWLCSTMEASTGKRFRVQPVVLYPGWYVESSVQWPEVWVLNEKQFPATVARQKAVIQDSDVHLLVYHLKRHVIARTQAKT